MAAPLTLRRRLLRLTLRAAALILLLAIVAFAGIVYAWARLAHSLPDLHGWHRDAPASEFRATDASSTYTFDDYLKQEDHVFAELDTLITTTWSTEPHAKFCRYTPDSICNPKTLFARNWNRTYILEAPNPIGGVLLIHGLSDSPYSLRTLGESLHDAGYTVIGLRVPGHGTCPRALADVTWQDWAAAVRIAMRGLRQRTPAGRPIIMVGYSNGAALAVDYTASTLDPADTNSASDTPHPNALVLISPMIGITPLAEFTTLYPAVARLSGEPKLAWSGIEPEIDPFKYASWPTNASLQAHRITTHVEQRLAALAAAGRMSGFPPVLAIQSAVDSTVIAHRTLDTLMARLPSPAANTVGPSELILFDIRRDDLTEGLLDHRFEEDIRPRLARTDLPYALTLITTRPAAALATPDDAPTLIARTRRAGTLLEEDIGVAWPQGVFSLSHVALPIPPSDPIYGPGTPGHPPTIPLGRLSLRGENGVLAMSPSLLLRMRYNPFYDWTERRILNWISDQAGEHASGPR